MTQEKTNKSLKDESILSAERELILYNDDVNTFDFVIETLVEVCDHDLLQAEQCALIVHFKGKCAVKTGDFYTLRSKHETMSDRGLTVEII
ncbi:MAG: ATP-dependent Clp protease adaptor ClpS [Bacteroidales bacterium]